MANATRDQWIHLRVDGAKTNMEGFLSKPASGKGPWPPVIVLMEVFGVNAHIQAITKRLAEAGFAALAINYYHRSTPNLLLDYSDSELQTGRLHKDKTTKDGLIADMKAAISYFQDDEDISLSKGVGAVGFCFGGHVAYIGATIPDVTATVSFYGAGIPIFCPGGGEPTVSLTNKIHGNVLCFFGGKDPLIPKEDVEKVQNALKEHNVRHDVMVYSEAEHGFMCNHRSSYDEEIAPQAWQKTLSFFKRHLAEKDQSLEAVRSRTQRI